MSDAADAVSPAAVRIVEATDLDVEAYAALQQRVFGHVLEENGIPLERLGPDVFAWKLAPPLGPGRVAMVTDGDGAMLGVVGAYPVRLAAGDERVRGWHLCDAATAEGARGRGYFHRVLTALHESTPAEDWTFAFPNGQSRGAFARQGYDAAVRVPLWFRPVTGRGRPDEGVEPIEGFDATHDDLAARLAAQRPLAPLRSAAYLSWRYLAHPFFRYQCFALRRDDRVDGLLVLHRMEARGRVSLWVMELLAVDRAGERALAQHARWLGKEQGCDVVLAMSKQRLPGALRVPPCFLPKEHLLMVRSGGPGEPRVTGEWDVQTGDWDTF